MEHPLRTESEEVEQQILGFDLEKKVVLKKSRHNSFCVPEPITDVQVQRLREHWRWIVANPVQPMGKWGKLS
jgi:hypothetical protein